MSRGGSLHCDRREHDRCNGIAVIMDQDGPQHLICDCYCHAETRRQVQRRLDRQKMQQLVTPWLEDAEFVAWLRASVPEEGT